MEVGDLPVSVNLTHPSFKHRTQIAVRYWERV